MKSTGSWVSLTTAETVLPEALTDEWKRPCCQVSCSQEETKFKLEKAFTKNLYRQGEICKTSHRYTDFDDLGTEEAS